MDELLPDRFRRGLHLHLLRRARQSVRVSKQRNCRSPGTSGRRSSNRLDPSPPEKKLIPVTLAPGRLRLATMPFLTAPPPVAKTIGTVIVACLATIAEMLSPTITATGR